MHMYSVLGVSWIHACTDDIAGTVELKAVALFFSCPYTCFCFVALAWSCFIIGIGSLSKNINKELDEKDY
jgi:hypothetical protein